MVDILMLSHWLNWDVKLSDSVVFRLLQPLGSNSGYSLFS